MKDKIWDKNFLYLEQVRPNWWCLWRGIPPGPLLQPQRRAWYHSPSREWSQTCGTYHDRKEQCWGSVTFWSDPDPYLWLTDPDLDPTTFIIDCVRMQRKNFFSSYFILITCPQAHHLQSKKFNFLLIFWVKTLFCRHYFRPLNTFLRKGKDPDPHLWLMDPDPGGPKTCGSCGSGSPTLEKRVSKVVFVSVGNTLACRHRASQRRQDPPPPCCLPAIRDFQS